jgi:protein-tyrosine-phosphatase
MAEVMLKHLHGRQVFVDSVGVRSGEADGFAIEVMAELGMEMQAHKSKTFDDLDDASFDLIVSLSPEAQHRAVEMTRSVAIELEFWHVFDPSLIEGSRERRLDAYREVRDDLFEKIQQRFPVIPVVDT